MLKLLSLCYRSLGLVGLVIVLALQTLSAQETWQEWNKQGKKWQEEGQHEKALEAFTKAKALVEQQLGADHLTYATMVYNTATVLKELAKYSEAEAFYLEAKRIRAQQLGIESKEYAHVTGAMASLYKTMGKWKESEALFLETIAIRAKVLGKNNPEYATALNNLAGLYKKMGKYALAEKSYMEVLDLRREQKGVSSVEYGLVLNNLAVLYEEQGLYEKAEQMYRQSLDIRKQLGKTYDEEYATMVGNLGILCVKQGKYAEAEPLLLKSKSISMDLVGKEHPSYASKVNYLGMLYEWQGRNEEALAMYEESKDIKLRTLGKDHPSYASALNNVGNMYRKTKQYKKAEEMYMEALQIRVKSTGKEHKEYAVIVNNLGIVYRKQGKYKDAERAFKEALDIKAKVLGKEHPSYANSLFSLSTVYLKQKKYKDAYPICLECKNIRAKSLGVHHPDYAFVLNQLGEIHLKLGESALAAPYLMEASQIFIEQTVTNFSFLSEKEKGVFWATFKHCFEIYNSFVLATGRTDLSGWLYDNALATKGLLFRSTRKMQNIIKKSNDPELNDLFQQWRGQKALLAELVQSNPTEKDDEKQDRLEVERKVNALEKELSARSSAFADAKDQESVSWKKIQEKLKPQEVAVEIVRSRYKASVWTDSVIYFALIISPSTKGQPDMVVLPNGKGLEGKYFKFYQNSIRYKESDLTSYEMFWAPIKERIGNAKRVYFSPDGILHQINWSTLFNAETKKYLKDEVDFWLLASTSDILTLARSSQETKINKDMNFNIFGHPDYDGGAKPMSPTEKEDQMEKQWLEMDKNQRFFDPSGKISDLEGTKEEVLKIASKAKEAGVEYHYFMESDATEEKLKALDRPDILHIATHGFYIPQAQESDSHDQPDEDSKENNPLLRSGILLANAELAIKGLPVGKENGILHAQEAMNLDLSQTDLVVLSACETGLGEIRAGEGVYGLQRAFRQAGAKTLVMSLWKVDDTATQELMVAFYDGLLRKKLTKRAAFSQAQQAVQQKFPHPYYWGAFVLVGE